MCQLFGMYFLSLASLLQSLPVAATSSSDDGDPIYVAKPFFKSIPIRRNYVRYDGIFSVSTCSARKASQMRS